MQLIINEEYYVLLCNTNEIYCYFNNDFSVCNSESTIL